MIRFPALRPVVFCMALVLQVVVTCALDDAASEEDSPSAALPAADVEEASLVDASSSDELLALREIGAALGAYVAAFNAHDAQALAAQWADDAEYLTPSGGLLHGRAEIAQQFDSLFAEEPGIELAVIGPKVKLLSSSVAIEEGEGRVTYADGEVAVSTYMAVYVLRDGKWLLERVRETDVLAEEQAAEEEIASPLDELGWLVGRWQDDTEGVTSEFACRFTPNKAFLTRSFRIVRDDVIELQGTQVFGWDEQQQQIRTWVFDSRGIVAEGNVTRESPGNWRTHLEAVLPDGSPVVFEALLTYIDEGRFLHQTLLHEVGGESVESLGAVLVVRQSETE